MKVCVLYCGINANDAKLKAFASKMAEGINSNGHVSEVFDMALEVGKIVSFYDYIAVISTSTGLFSKNIPDNVLKFLRAAGSISGKRCSCYLIKKGFRKAKALQTLMKTMESEGMYLKVSDILLNENHAYTIGKHLHIESGLKD